LWSWPLTSI